MLRRLRISLFLCAVILPGCWVQGNVSNYADTDSRAFLNKAVPVLMQSWNMRALDGMVPDGFYSRTSRKSVAVFFAACHRKLGALRTFTVSKSAEQVGWYTGTGTVKTASYLLNATFQKGNGKVYVEIRKVRDVWKLYSLNVESDALYT